MRVLKSFLLLSTSIIPFEALRCHNGSSTDSINPPQETELCNAEQKLCMIERDNNMPNHIPPWDKTPGTNYTYGCSDLTFRDPNHFECTNWEVPVLGHCFCNVDSCNKNECGKGPCGRMTTPNGTAGNKTSSGAKKNSISTDPISGFLLSLMSMIVAKVSME